MTSDPYFRDDLALIQERAYGQHGDRVAAGILALLEPARGGLVLELGCGAGALTKHLLAAGHRVLATDASPALLARTRGVVGPEADLAVLRLPDDPIPAADAIVAVGHVISYLQSPAEIDRALTAMAGALRPGGVLAFDICDLDWGAGPGYARPLGLVGPDWAVITEFSAPAPDKFVRDLTTFVPDGNGAWRRDSEHHENTLVDVAKIPDFLRSRGISAEVRTAFGDERFPLGLKAVVGARA